MPRTAALLAQINLAASSDAVRILSGVMALGWALFALLPTSYHLSAVCGRITPADIPDLIATGQILPSLSTLTISWVAMTLAMMPLFVVSPVAHVRRCSLPRRRAWATLLFGLGYGLCWVVAGSTLAPLALLLSVILGVWPAAILILAVALCWSACPLAQVARNACHRRQRIGAFGAAADLDCLRQGIATGLACVGTCWPWMLLPALAGNAHVVVMTLVVVILAIDRCAFDTSVHWQVPPIFRLITMMFF